MFGGMCARSQVLVFSPLMTLATHFLKNTQSYCSDLVCISSLNCSSWSHIPGLYVKTYFASALSMIVHLHSASVSQFNGSPCNQGCTLILFRRTAQHSTGHHNTAKTHNTAQQKTHSTAKNTCKSVQNILHSNIDGHSTAQQKTHQKRTAQHRMCSLACNSSSLPNMNFKSYVKTLVIALIGNMYSPGLLTQFRMSLREEHSLSCKCVLPLCIVSYLSPNILLQFGWTLGRDL